MKTKNDKLSSGNPLPTDSDFYDEGFNDNLEAEMFDNGPETHKERVGRHAMNGAAWLAAIVAVFAVAILIAAACNLGPKSSADKPSSGQVAALSSKAGNSANANANSGQFEFYQDEPVLIESVTVYGIETGNAPAASSSTNSSASSSLSSADEDRIEREAREVIHGDFGNNPSREKALGADYALVQARVNQILHS